MNRTLCIGAALLGLCGGPAAAEGAALRYTLDPGGPPLEFTPGQVMTPIDAPPPGMRLPAFTSPRPLLLTAKVGDGPENTFLFALDESEPGMGYDLLYADGDRDGDLAEEKPLRLTRWGWTRGFRPVRLLIDVDGARVQYHAAVAVEERGDTPRYRLLGWSYYSGEVELGGVVRQVALVDRNANGRFDDLDTGLDRTRPGDALLVDWNGNGTFDLNEPAAAEYVPISRRVPAGPDGQRFALLTVRPDGAGFRWEPDPSPPVRLRSGYPEFTLELASPEGALRVRGRDGVAAIPAGDYRIQGWQVEQRARDGSLWRVAGRVDPAAGEGKRLVARGDTSLPALAAPLVAQVGVSPTVGREFEFTLGFTAASQETVSQVTRGGEQMPVPRLRIVDARGRKVADLPFHYG